MYNTRAILTFAIIVISSALVSCSPSKTEKIYMAEQKWLEGGRIKYQMTITNSSLWLEEEYTVIVENGVVKIVQFDCTPGLIGFEDLCEGSKEFISQLDTVDELFRSR